jgi:outer membrane protein OmpA-like peptidoglycan-associated protein
VSDGHGGYGGTDIFFITRNKKGKWSKPINMGPTINTPHAEYSVFLSQDGNTLYFSSMGHDGIGGYDIFKSERKNGVFGTPQNLGMPINTPYDDVHYMEVPNSNVAYYATCQRNQNMGGLDIYKITYITPKDYLMKPELAGLSLIGEPLKHQPLKETEVDDRATLIRGLVFDADTKEPLSSQLVLFDLATLDSLATFMSDENTGAFRISLPPGKNYAINAIKEGYLFFSLNFDVPETADKQVIDQEIPLQKVQKNKAIVLKNIFFDTGKSTLRPESDLEIGKLEQILKENPTMVVEVSGHTDNVGSAASNQKLSADRAQAVVASLIARGIDASRMISAGYGMDRPIADNKTEEGRQLNRRTEFKIIEL